MDVVWHFGIHFSMKRPQIPQTRCAPEIDTST